MTKPNELARLEAERAKAQLTGTIGAVKKGLLPSALIGLAKEAAKARAIKVAAGSILAARKKPKLAVGVAIASALYAFRKPIAAALKQRLSKETKDEQTD